MKAGEFEYLNCFGVMVIVEVKDEPVRDFVLLVHVYIKPQDPDVENEYRNSSPHRKVTRKFVVLVQADVVNSDYHDEQNQK